VTPKEAPSVSRKCWTAENIIMILTPDNCEGSYSGSCCQLKIKWDSQSQTQEESQNMFYNAVLTDSDMSDADFTTLETNEFTEEDGCENSVDSLTQPLQPNDLVLLKLVTNKTLKYFVALIQKIGPNGL